MIEVKSPLPGTFYHKPSPEAQPYKAPGDVVNAGDTIGLVEVMKTFVEIKAEEGGTFRNYVVDNEQAVKVEEVLAEIES